MYNGTCGHPSLSYEPHPEGDHVYRNGCVLRRFRYFADAKKKVDEFNKHPERHMKFWNDQSGVASKDTKCLGVDVPYDAWEEPEVTYKRGSWFQCDGRKYFLARDQSFGSGFSAMILINVDGDGNTWSGGVRTASWNIATQDEFNKISSGAKFTPIDKPF